MSARLEEEMPRERDVEKEGGPGEAGCTSRVSIGKHRGKMKEKKKWDASEAWPPALVSSPAKGATRY